MIFIYSTHACMQVHKNACLAPSDSPEYHAPVHAVVGMAGQGLSHNRASRAFFVCVDGRDDVFFTSRREALTNESNLNQTGSMLKQQAPRSSRPFLSTRTTATSG